MTPISVSGSPAALLFGLALLMCSFRVALANFTNYGVEQGGLRIRFPVSQSSKRFAMALADFGKPRYGGTLTGQLVYPSSDSKYYNPNIAAPQCKPPSACNFGCSAFSDAKPAPYSLPQEPGKFHIMLLDRGPNALVDEAPCYFLDKVWHAQLAGADAVLVANDEPGDVSTAVVPDNDEVLREELAKLSISAAMISKADGDFLKELLSYPQPSVTVTLNWTDIIPRKQLVSWELWTNSNDECGTLCDEQRAFVKGMREVSKKLSQTNQTSFTPHYLVWACPQDYINTKECQSECIANGTYCAPDPDNELDVGYNGKDVLLMNVRQLCFHKLAASVGAPWLWWDYVDTFGDTCRMADNNYTAACARTVFDLVGGASLTDNALEQWLNCSDVDGIGRYSVPILDAELAAQKGSGDESPISVLPSVRVNGQQYRGTLDTAGVVRALCSGFPKDLEPAVCNAKWVSDDECAPGGVGYLACQSEMNLSNNRTRCVNTFTGYTCECTDGWTRSVDAFGEEMCVDVNECLATSIPLSDPKCSCPRCACINTIGSYKCTGELPNMCTAEKGFGGCWMGKLGNRAVNACRDTFWDYQQMAAQGHVDDNTPWHTCRCPGCFYSSHSADGKLTCEASCSESECKGYTCVANTHGASGGSRQGGVGGGAVFFIVIATIAATSGLMFLAYQTILKSRMHDEIRDIMSSYMPLDERAASAAGGGGLGGAARAPPRRFGQGGGGGGADAEDARGGYVAPSARNGSGAGGFPGRSNGGGGQDGGGGGFGSGGGGVLAASGAALGAGFLGLGEKLKAGAGGLQKWGAHLNLPGVGGGSSSSNGEGGHGSRAHNAAISLEERGPLLGPLGPLGDDEESHREVHREQGRSPGPVTFGGAPAMFHGGDPLGGSRVSDGGAKRGADSELFSLDGP